MTTSKKEVKTLSDLIKNDSQQIIKLLTCKLCSGIFRNPYTIIECMHTFCKACIYKYMSKIKEDHICPECSLPLGGKPLDKMLFDTSVEDMVDTLFGEFKQIDEKAEVNDSIKLEGNV
jgi:hypothetical protein